MANIRAETRTPTATENEKTTEYHVTIESNNGQVIAGNNNSITTFHPFNVYNYPSADRETKKKKTSKRNKKKRRSENEEADSSQNSKNSEAVKGGEDERKKVRRKSHVLSDEQSCEGSANEEVKYQDNEFVTTTSEEEWSDTAGNHLMSGTAKESKKANNLSSSHVLTISCKVSRELFPEQDVMDGNDKTQSKHHPKRRRKKLRNRKDSYESKMKTNQEAMNKAPMETSKECIKLWGQFVEEVQQILHPLRDNGNWKTFDDKWNEFMSNSADPVWEALLKLEYGIRISYHSQFKSNLDEARKMLYEGRKIIMNIADPSIKQFCEGRLNCYLTSVYRRKKKYGRAQKCLEIAERSFESSDFLYDKATLFYEKGSLFHEFDKKGAVNESAKKSFEKCFEFCKQLKAQKGWDFVKKGQFAQLKKALLLLGCSTEQGRKRPITDEDLKEANKCIEEFDRETKNQNIPNGEKLQLLLAKSDQGFRKQDLVQAKEFALQAAKLADEHGFDSRPANKRLQDFEDRETRGEANHTPQDHEENKENLSVVAQTTVEGLSGDADGSANQSTGNSDDEEDSM